MSNLNHLIELMELYPINIGKCGTYVLSYNPNLTIEYVLNHPYCMWNPFSLSMNPSISTPFNVKNNKSLKWANGFMFCSSSFQEKDILEKYNDEKDNWCITYILQNGNITPHFFETINKSWTDYWILLVHNEHFTMELCNHFKKYPFLLFNSDVHLFLEKLAKNRNLTISMFDSLCEYTQHTINPYPNLLQFKKIYIINNPNVSEIELLSRFSTDLFPTYHMDWYNLNVNATISILYRDQSLVSLMMTSNPNVLFEDLLVFMTNKTYAKKCEEVYDYCCSNHNLTWENVCDYSWMNWNWYGVFTNPFNKSKNYYRETKLMRDLLDTFDLEFNYIDLMMIL